MVNFAGCLAAGENPGTLVNLLEGFVVLPMIMILFDSFLNGDISTDNSPHLTAVFMKITSHYFIYFYLPLW